MTSTLDRQTSQAIERLAAEAARPSEPSATQSAARKTGGVPVYADLGGVVTITPGGAVLVFDPDKDTVTSADDRLKTLAFARAARRFPDLSALAPPRVADATDCPQCGGSGVILDGMDCGICLGTGWIANK
jgi:hypothetical protein